MEFTEQHSLVPLDGRADDLDKRQGDLGVPLLRRLENEVVQRLADLCERERCVSALSGGGWRVFSLASKATHWYSGRSMRLLVFCWIGDKGTQTSVSEGNVYARELWCMCCKAQNGQPLGHRIFIATSGSQS